MSDPNEPAGAGAPSEEELRAAYEAELERITALDMIAQAAVSLLNIGARRLGAPGGAEGGRDTGRDLEQVRDAIDGARGLLEIVERRMPGQVAPLRDALSRLQMSYAKEVGSGGAGAPPGGAPPGGTPPAGGEPKPQEPEQPGQRRPGPAESSGRLWVPGS
jgi:hypothetical protein